MKTRRRTISRLLAMAAAGIALAASQAVGQTGSVEVIQNTTFDTGLAPWFLEEGIDPSWNPVTNGAVSLHPPSNTMGYMGPVLCQPLNVTNIAGQSATAAADLWVVNGDLTSNIPMIAMEIEYLDTNGQRHEATVLQSSLQEIGQSDATNPSHQQASPYTFPADADRLVEVCLVKKGPGEVMADNVSLDVANATVGPVPAITGVSPTTIAYGETVIITGTNFGSSQGQGEVLLNDRPDGITVDSWSDTQIAVKVSAPALPGRLVVRQGTESNPSGELQITSPFFFITSATPEHITLFQGQTLYLPLGLGFANGYTLPQGTTITWSLVDLSGAAAPTHTFTPQSMTAPGGTLLTANTSNMTPGEYTFEVRATDGNVTVAGRGEVEVRKITAVQFVDLASRQPLSALNITRLGKVQMDIDILITDDTGAKYSAPDFLPMTISSSDQAVVQVLQSPYDVSVFAMGPGTAKLTATFPGGFQYSLPVTFAPPDNAPTGTASLTPDTITNTETAAVAFEATSQAGLTNTGYSTTGLHLLEGQNCGYNTDYTQYACSYTMDQNGQMPPSWPQYAVFHATAGSGTATATGIAILTVTNDPSYATMEGVAVSVARDLPMQMVENGTFAFFDPSDTTTPSFSREVFVNDPIGRYRLGRIIPGTYLVRYSTLGGQFSQWYPGTSDPGTAEPVTFSAGQTTKDINFFFHGAGDTTGGETGTGTGDTGTGTGDTGTGTGDTGTGGTGTGDTGTGDTGTGGTGSGIFFTPVPTSGTAPLTVTFTCEPDPTSSATVASADFDFDRDGTYDVTNDPDGVVQHTYTMPGTYDAVCRLTDSTGATGDSLPVTITVTSGNGTGDTGTGDTGTGTGDTGTGDTGTGDTGTGDTGTGDTGTGGTGMNNPWDCNNNGKIDLADILCQLRILASEQQPASQP